MVEKMMEQLERKFKSENGRKANIEMIYNFHFNFPVLSRSE